MISIKNDISISKKVKIDNFNLFAQSFGKFGDPAMLLISGAGASAMFWSDSFCMALVDKGFFIIRYDHRDVGLSSNFDSKKNKYSIYDLTDDAVKILDIYNLEKVTIVGHSMGGYIAQDFAIRYPNKVEKLVLISTGPFFKADGVDLNLTEDEKEKLSDCWKAMLKNKPTQNYEESLSGFLKVWSYLNGDFKLDLDLATDYTKDLYFRSEHKIGIAKNHVKLMNEFFDNIQPKGSGLENIILPVLIIHGSKDVLTFPRIAEEMSKVLNNSKFALINGMGHMFFNRKLEYKLVNLILDFVKA